MSRVFVYADPHFGHAEILTFAQRPWTSIDKHDHDLVQLYNSVVRPFDVVYWLGDVTLRGPEKKQWIGRFLSKMHGTKILIFGNHDEWHWRHYLDAGFQSCHTFFEMDYRNHPAMLAEGRYMVRMCHDPAWAQSREHLWVCGHLHNCAFVAPSHIAIVSVELTEYKPVLLDEIVEGLRPGSGVLRTGPRPNRTPKAWPEVAAAYDPKYGDEKLCECGHFYFRHFDTYNNMEPVGCKYCQCSFFIERKEA